MIKCHLIEQRGEERRGEERRGEGGTEDAILLLEDTAVN